MLAGHVAALITDAARLPPGMAHLQPNRAAIDDAMAQAATASAPGDTVVFCFSGHGIQTPDQGGDEPGGHDEIVPLMHAKAWKGLRARSRMPCATTRCRPGPGGPLDRGVQVVGANAPCRSGTGFRAAPGAGTARVVDPASLGIAGGVPAVVASIPHR